jgi:hypothetical protein
MMTFNPCSVCHAIAGKPNRGFFTPEFLSTLFNKPSFCNDFEDIPPTHGDIVILYLKLSVVIKHFLNLITKVRASRSPKIFYACEFASDFEAAGFR